MSSATFHWLLASDAGEQAAPIASTLGADALLYGAPDLELDSDGDLLVEGGDLALVAGVDAVKQHVGIACQWFRGEWFLAPEKGVPYFEQVLIKSPNLRAIEGLFRSAVTGVPGVDSVEEMSLDHDRRTRRLSVRFRARAGAESIEGTADVAVE